MPRVISLLAGVLLIAGGGTGCAQERRSVKVERSVAYSPTGQVVAPSAVVTESTVVHERVVDEDKPRGVISTTVHFVGELLSLPFRLIGGLLRAIF